MVGLAALSTQAMVKAMATAAKAVAAKAVAAKAAAGTMRQQGSCGWLGLLFDGGSQVDRMCNCMCMCIHIYIIIHVYIYMCVRISYIRVYIYIIVHWPGLEFVYMCDIWMWIHSCLCARCGWALTTDCSIGVMLIFCIPAILLWHVACAQDMKWCVSATQQWTCLTLAFQEHVPSGKLTCWPWKSPIFSGFTNLPTPIYQGLC